MAEGMLYLDEQIAALRRKERKKAFRSIEKGIYTGNTLRHFKELRIFEAVCDDTRYLWLYATRNSKI